MSKWILVRHCETPWNLEGRIQGHADVPLDEKGLRQAEVLRRRLATVDIQAAYASNLARTLQTAQVVLNGRAVPLFPSPELRELSYGQWEGLTFKEVEEKYPSEYAQVMKASEDFAPQGGESLKDLVARVERFTAGLKASTPEDTLLIVAHGGSLRALVVCMLELPLAAFWRLYFAPASVSEVDIYPHRAVLRLLNDTSHLRDGM